MRKSLTVAGLVVLFGMGLGCSGDAGNTGGTSAKVLTIESFAVDKRRVEMGEEVKVSWSIKHADAVELWANDVFVETDGKLQGEILVPVDETTAFRLVARKDEDRADRTIVVGVKNFDPSPVILAFTSTPRELDEGEAVTLSWITFNATSIEIRGPEGTPLELGGASVEQGEVTVHPSTDATYRIFANGEGTTEQTVFVKVRGKPGADLALSSSRVEPGETVTLSWEVEDATHVVIREVGGKVLVDTKTSFSGSIQVAPEQSTTYELRAMGAWKDVTHTVHVDVPPEIVSFAMVEKGPVGVGRLATLTWKTRGATELEVGNSQGESEPITGFRVAEGIARIPASPDGVFELKARSAGEEQVQRITVETLEPPTVADFRVTPDFMSARPQPVKVTVSWAGIENADEVSLEGSVIGRVGIFQPPFEDGALELWLRQTNELTLTARNAAGDTVRTTTAILVPLPVIEDFTLFPRHAGVGETIQVSWNVTGSDTIALEFNGQPVAVDPKLGAGSVPFTITEPGTFRLVARNEADGTVERSRQATMGSPEIRAFTVPAATVRAGSALAFTWATLGGTRLDLLRNGTSVCQKSDPDAIEQGGCNVAGTPLGVHTFTLVLENGIGEVVERNLTIRVTDGPIIHSFTSTFNQACPTSGPRLSWSVSEDVSGNPPILFLTDGHGTAYDLSGKDPFQDFIDLPFTEVGMEAYTLRAETAGTVSDLRSHYVEMVEATFFRSLNVQPPKPSKGQTVTISWDAACANEVTVFHGKISSWVSSKPFLDLRSTGGTWVPILNQCGTGFEPADEGCEVFNFPSGFRFPFDGQNRSAIKIYSNGFGSFDLVRTGSTWSNISTLPSTSNAFVHLSPFWRDMLMSSNETGFYWKLVSEEGKNGLAIQWGRNTNWTSTDNLNVEIVLWENGVFDYRYGTMTASSQSVANGGGVTIGWQTTNGQTGETTNNRLEVPGGLSNKSYSYGFQPRSPTGTYTFTAGSSESIEIKASGYSEESTILQIDVQ